MKAQTVLWRHFISLVSAGGEGKGNSPAFFPGFGYNLFSGLRAIKAGHASSLVPVLKAWVYSIQRYMVAF